MDGSEQLKGRWRELSQGPPQKTLFPNNVWISVLRLPISAFLQSPFQFPPDHCWLLAGSQFTSHLPALSVLHSNAVWQGRSPPIRLALRMAVLTIDKKPLLTQLPEALQALGIDLLTVWVWAQCRGWVCWNADRGKKQSSIWGKQASLVWGTGST